MSGEIILTKHLGGVEDILLDATVDTVTQNRNKTAVVVHTINANTIPVVGKLGSAGFVSIKEYIDNRVVDTTGDFASLEESIEAIESSIEDIISEVGIKEIESATLCNIGAVTENNVRILGTTDIHNFGVAPVGTIKRVLFDNILTLVSDSDTISLFGLPELITATGDTAVFIKDTNYWRLIDYTKYDGSSITNVIISTLENARPMVDDKTAISPLTLGIILQEDYVNNYYKSDWTAVTIDTNYTFEHGLGTALLDITILGILDTEEIFIVPTTITSAGNGISVELTDTEIKLRTGTNILYYRLQGAGQTGTTVSNINNLGIRVMAKKLAINDEDIEVINVTRSYWWCDTCNYGSGIPNAMLDVIVAAGGTTISLVSVPSGMELTTDATEDIVITMGHTSVTYAPDDELVFVNAGAPYMIHKGTTYSIGQDKPTVYFSYRNYTGA